MRPAVRSLARFLDEVETAAARRLGERAGPYGLYVEAPIPDGLGAGLVRRHDAVKAHLERGLAAGLDEPLDVLFARTNLFRGIYAESDRVLVPGCEPLLGHPGLIAAARELTGCDVVRPVMLYANLLLPGQELAVHTDTPHYRGVDKASQPEWLLVAMAHAGLFEHWRVRVAAAVLFLGGCEGGELIAYARGPDRPPTALPARDGDAVALDADAVFHGVARVGGPSTPAPPVEAGMRLRFEHAGERWQLERDGECVAHYPWGTLRFSLQWKALCFADAEEERVFRERTDDLTAERAVATLVEDLRRRGRIGGTPPDGTELALLMIDEYIRFPAPTAGA